MILKVISSANYADKEKNYGDCMIINTGLCVIVYDCGSEEHAIEVERYLDENGYEKAHIILSHNDADHFDGIPYLIEKDRVASITTLLLLKHIDAILKELDDGRRNTNSLKEQIKERFDNVAKLSGNNLNDSLDETLQLDPCVNFVGPDYDYMLEAVAKALDNSESDTIDLETIENAISVQVELIVGNHKILLTGDASFAAIEDKVTEYDAIQLPHHGKLAQAEKIFEANENKPDILYLVSDNTGNSNGGSDELMKIENCAGKRIKNTKSGEINLDLNSFEISRKGCYGDEIYSFKQ